MATRVPIFNQSGKLLIHFQPCPHPQDVTPGNPSQLPLPESGSGKDMETREVKQEDLSVVQRNEVLAHHPFDWYEDLLMWEKSSTKSAKHKEMCVESDFFEDNTSPYRERILSENDGVIFVNVKLEQLKIEDTEDNDKDVTAINYQNDETSPEHKDTNFVENFSKRSKSVNLVGGGYDEDNGRKRKVAETFENKISERESKMCKTCNYLTSDWQSHVLTRKHIKKNKITENKKNKTKIEEGNVPETKTCCEIKSRSSDFYPENENNKFKIKIEEDNVPETKTSCKIKGSSYDFYPEHEKNFKTNIEGDNVPETETLGDIKSSSSGFYPENVGLYGGEETPTKKTTNSMANEIDELCAKLGLPALKFECEETIPVICTCYIKNKRIITQAIMKEHALYKANVLALTELSVIAENFISQKPNNENPKKAPKKRKRNLERSEVQSCSLSRESTKSKDLTEYLEYTDAKNIPEGSKNILHKLDAEMVAKDRNLLGCIRILREESKSFKGNVYEPFLSILRLQDYPEAADTIMIDGSVQERDLMAFSFTEYDDMNYFHEACNDKGFKDFSCIKIYFGVELEHAKKARREEKEEMEENLYLLENNPGCMFIGDDP